MCRTVSDSETIIESELNVTMLGIDGHSSMFLRTAKSERIIYIGMVYYAVPTCSIHFPIASCTYNSVY